MGDVFNYGEEWAELEDFPRYVISTEGRVYNQLTGRYMRWSPNNYGHPKISLLAENGQRHTRSVAMLVAREFLEKPNEACDRIIYLDGDLKNFRVDNLAWRPRWFGWKYSRQFKKEIPLYYENLPVINLDTDKEYSNIVEAAREEGLLFDQIWRSTYTGEPVFPYGSIWAVNK